jgi:hypothetical protein
VRTFDNFQIILIQNVLINTVKCQDEFLVQFFCSFPHFLLTNNLSQQILSLHILQFITAHFTFITAQIGYHCTLKLGMERIDHISGLHQRKSYFASHLVPVQRVKSFSPR